MFKQLTLLALLLIVLSVDAQEYDQRISLKNPSFEGFAAQSVVPMRWFDCGNINFPSESAPDTHPGGFWEVLSPPADGSTYLGMVARDNDSWESVSQRLSEYLVAGNCYAFSIKLAKSTIYKSQSQKTGLMDDYTTPLVFKIWGGNVNCSKAELLAELGPVTNLKWKQYEVKMEPNQSHQFITFEAFYETPILFPYNGNVLVDDASDFVQVPCNEPVDLTEATKPLEKEAPIAVAEKPQPKPKKPDVKEPAEKVEEVKEEVKEEVVAEIPVVKEKPKKPVLKEEPKEKITEALDKETIVEGQTIKIENLYFRADTSSINFESLPALDELYTFLQENSSIKVEVGGHTNGVPPDSYCDKLSKARAKAVADYIIDKGIGKDRISYVGYGKRYPIATNDTKEGRKKNQRVEIKILSLGK